MTSSQQPPATARRLGSQSLIVLVGNVFTLVVGLPLQIVVSRVLGAEGLGIYGLLEGAVNTANGFVNFGAAQTAVRYVPAHLEKREYGHVRRLIKLGVALLLAVGGIAYLLLLAALPFLESIWPVLRDQSHVVLLMGLLLPLGLLMFLLQQSLRGFQEIRYMVLGSSILQLTVKAVVTLAAFAVGWHLIGYVLATVVATAFGVLWMGYGLVKRMNAMPLSDGGSVAVLPEWRRFAAISYVSNLLGTSTSYIDRFLLGAFVGSDTVGVLLVLRQLQQIPQVFSQMLLMVGAPMFAAAHARNDRAEREHLYVLMTDWLMKSSLPLLMFLFLFAEPVLSLFGAQFAERGGGILWILLVGQSFNLVCGPTGSMAMMSGLEAAVLRLSAYNTVLSAVLLIALAPTLGLLGVAVSNAITMIFINVAVIVVLRRRLGFRWWNRRFLGWLPPSLAAIAVGLAVLYFGIGHGAVALALTLMAMYVAFAATLLAQGINDDERDLLRHLKDRLLGGGAAQA